MKKLTLSSKIITDNYCEYVFNNYDIQDREKTVTEVPIPQREELEEMRDWNIFLICGRSGGGKSTILNEMGGVTPIVYDNNRAVISQFQEFSEEEVCDLLQSVGLSSVPTWLRKPSELSNGEKARLDICKALYEAMRSNSIAVIDEFTSTVNRSVAKSMSFALQRYAREKGLKVIIASCHYDIVDWLQPDYVFNLNHCNENGDVEIERIVYSDSSEYNVQQGVLESQTLSDAMEVNY